jgi:hypothetical protein
MFSESVETTNTAAETGAQGASVTPEKTPSRKTASAKKSAPKATKAAKAGKPKAAGAAKTKKAAPTTATGKAPKAAKSKSEGTREGSKTATILELLRRTKGATLSEIMEATSWQAHSVRGFISGTLGKKMGLTVNSVKGENGQRTYSLSK